jgi:hypothetical protein
MSRQRSTTLLALAFAFAIPSFCFAHHSFAMFDPAKSVTLQGEVKEFRWTNPHVFIQLMATAQGGASEEWSIEMTSPEHLARAGWRPGTLKRGDKVMLVVHPLRTGEHGGQFVSGTGTDGVTLGKAAATAAAASGGAAK